MGRALYEWTGSCTRSYSQDFSKTFDAMAVSGSAEKCGGSVRFLCVDKRVRFGHWNARIRCCRWDFGEGVMRDHRRRHGPTALFAGHSQRHGDKVI